MVLLMLFGLVAGAGTALSPCVLPVLPIVLSAGATGGRRRPLGIVVGLALSFTFATVALVYVIEAFGLPGDLLRKIAIATMLCFGALLMLPPLAARLEAWLSRLAPQPVGIGRARDGFWSGLAVGGSLGFVYAPCAGPILAGVITASASQPFSGGRLAVALSYGIGSALVLYVLMLGGRRLITSFGARSAHLQIAMGGLMVAAALAMLGNYDIRFQNAIASDLPAFLVNPTEPLESTGAAQTALAGLRGSQVHGIGARALAEQNGAQATGPGTEKQVRGTKAAPLPVLGDAPEFVDYQRWFNTPGERPLTLSSLRGRIVLVDFWTYTCINCLRTLPYLTAWDRRYRRDGLTIVGVHTPEFPFERDAGNVAAAIERNDIRYPVVQDNEYGTWNAYGNQYWPAEYFIDARGRVRFAHFGEGSYGEKEKVIRELLAEAGARVGRGAAHARALRAAPGVTTPETYLGAARAERFTNAMLAPGLRDLGHPPLPPRDNFAYYGRWKITRESATARGGSVVLNFGARRVYLVLGSSGPRRMRVLLDGRPIPSRLAGADVHNGVATVSAHRLYNLVDLPAVGHHLLRLVPEAGVSGYAFTFG